MKIRALVLALILILITLTAVRGQETAPPAMSLSGGGLTEDPAIGLSPGRLQSLIGLAQAAHAQAQLLGQENTHFLIIPSARVDNPDAITPVERENLLALAQAQAEAIAAACQEIGAEITLPCQTTVLPIYPRSDAANTTYIQKILSSLSAIYFLDGDPLVAMRNLADTPLEQVIADAYRSGVLIAGDGAGADLQSLQLLAGYQPDFAAENALAFGAIDLRALPNGRGLSYGLDQAIIQSELFYEGRLGLLLNALIDPGSVNLGLGIDRYAGVDLSAGNLLTRVYGSQTALIVDAETYHAADSAQYRGRLNYLSLRNILVHAFSAGEVGYRLDARSFSEFSTPQTISRQFETLRLPSGAGSLYLLSSLSPSWSASTLLNRFLNESGGRQARVLHLLLGYPNPEAIQAQADLVDQLLGREALPLAINAATPAGFEPDLTGYDAILISLVDRQHFPELRDKLGVLRVAWFGGKPILASGDAAVILGAHYWLNAYQSSPILQDPALTHFDPTLHEQALGLNLLPVNLEVGLTDSNRWGGLFSLAYRHPDLIALGMADQTALVLQSERTVLEGENIVASLDLRNAAVGEAGSNVRFVNGLLDIFAPGDIMEPRPADAAAALVPAATPLIVLPSPTPTASPTITATPAPTRRP
jgi:cyanophycinase